MSSVELIYEIECRAFGVPGMQFQAAFCSRIATGAAGDRRHGDTKIVVRTLARDLSALEQQSPKAFPAASNGDADAVSLILSHAGAVGGIVDRVCKDQEIAELVARSAHGNRRVRDGMLHDHEAFCGHRGCSEEGKSSAQEKGLRILRFSHDSFTMT